MEENNGDFPCAPCLKKVLLDCADAHISQLSATFIFENDMSVTLAVVKNLPSKISLRVKVQKDGATMTTEKYSCPVAVDKLSTGGYVRELLLGLFGQAVGCVKMYGLSL